MALNLRGVGSLVAIGFFLGSTQLQAAPLSLNEVLKEGMSYSLSIQKAQSVKNAARAELKASVGKVFPEIDAVASAQGIKTPTAVDGHNVGDGSVVNDYRAYLELTQPIYSGGAVGSGYSYAKTNEKAAEQRLFDAKQVAAEEIIKAYFLAAENQILVNLAKDNSQQLKSYLETTTRYASIGRSKNIDRLQAEANYALSESDVLSRENEFESAISALEKLTGRKFGLNVELSGRPIEKPPVFASRDSVINRAVQVNPEIKALELDVKKTQYSTDALMSTHRPKLTLNGTWGYKSPDRTELIEDPSNTYTIGLTLRIPIFSGLTSLADRQKNMETVVQSEKTLAISRDNLKNEINTTIASLERDSGRIALAQKAVKSSRLAVQAAIKDYRQGVVSSTDVLSAHRTRYEAERQFNAAEFSYQKNLLSFRKLIGEDLVKIYQ